MEIGEKMAMLAAAAVVAPPPLPQYRMHVDADRDGSVDDDWRGLSRWAWGRGRRGAMFMCNNDDDDSASTEDHTDTRINGGNDASEVAPLVIRRTAPAPPGSWTGFLEVDAALASFVRVFDGQAAGAAEIIGPTRGASHQLPDLNFTQRELGVEAVRYAGQNFDGFVMVTFRIEDGGTQIYSQRAKLRVAPWMMPNHLDPAEKVFVANIGAPNARFRRDLAPLVAAAGCSLQERVSPPADRWMQDCMEIGFCAMPGRATPAVMRAKRDRPLQTFPRTLLAPDFGYQEIVPVAGDTTFDSNGNLEVTPPILSGTRTPYPWGRIYYGPGSGSELFDRETKEFLRAQRVQAPFEVDTGWLTVGHVDEVVSFVPAPGGRGFKLLVASPLRAYRILRDAARTHGAERLLVGRSFPGHGAAEVSIRDFLTVGISGLGLTGVQLRAFNLTVARHMQGVKAAFRRAIATRADEIIEIPILYFPSPGQTTVADALTGGMVNMLVVNSHCIIPKAFGPEVGGVDLFEQDLQTQLSALGLTPSFIDDWFEYHVQMGEVHCGTNTLRRPTTPAKWWEFGAR
jgi:hypothetical protein